MECLSAEVAPGLFKSTILSCMEYCCYVWAGTPSCYLDMLDKLNYKRLSRTVGVQNLVPLLNSWVIEI